MTNGLLNILAAANTGHASVPGYQTWAFAVILAVTLIALATEKIHKTVLVLLVALACLLLGDYWHFFPRTEGHHLPVYIQMIEWEVIGIVIGASVFVRF